MKSKTKIFIGLILTSLILAGSYLLRDQVSILPGDLTTPLIDTDISVTSIINTLETSPGELLELELEIATNKDIPEELEIITTIDNTDNPDSDMTNWGIYSAYDFETSKESNKIIITQKLPELLTTESQKITLFLAPDKLNEVNSCANYTFKLQSSFAQNDADTTNNQIEHEINIDPENMSVANIRTGTGGITLDPGEEAVITYTFTPSEIIGGAIMNKAFANSGTTICQLSLLKPTTVACNDGQDNDGDGLIDLKDPDCLNPYDKKESEDDFLLTIGSTPNSLENGVVDNIITVKRLNIDVATAELSLSFSDDSHIVIIQDSTQLNDVVVTDLSSPLILNFNEQDEHIVKVQKNVNNNGLDGTPGVQIDETITLNYELDGTPKEQTALGSINVKGKVIVPVVKKTQSSGGGGGGGGGGYRYPRISKKTKTVEVEDEPVKTSPNSICTIVKPEWKDSDKDGLSDNVESFLGSNPNKIDTDADGFTDGVEFFNNYNYLTKDNRKIWVDLKQEWQVAAVTGLYPVVLEGIKDPEDSLKEFKAIIKSEKTNRFNPNDFATRAEVAHILFQRIEILCKENITYDSPPFPDVKEKDYFYESIAYLYSRKVLDGYKDGFFRPSKIINRAEAAKLIANTFGINVEDIEQLKGNKFSDVPLVNWYAPFVNALRVQKITKGYRDQGSNIFKPGESITRAEIAELIRKAASIAEKKYIGVSLEDEVKEKLQALSANSNQL